jgi:hypothetical protein
LSVTDKKSRIRIRSVSQWYDTGSASKYHGSTTQAVGVDKSVAYKVNLISYRTPRKKFWKILLCRRSVVIWPKAIVREKDIIKPVRRLPKGGLAIQEHSPVLFSSFLMEFLFSPSFRNTAQSSFPVF